VNVSYAQDNLYWIHFRFFFLNNTRSKYVYIYRALRIETALRVNKSCLKFNQWVIRPTDEGMWNILSHVIHYRHVSTTVAYIIRITDIHSTVHRNIISILKPTRCTNVLNLFYFGMTLYMFRAVFPSIVRSSRLYIQQQAFVKLMPVAVCTFLNSWWWTTMLPAGDMVTSRQHRRCFIPQAVNTV